MMVKYELTYGKSKIDKNPSLFLPFASKSTQPRQKLLSKRGNIIDVAKIYFVWGALALFRH